MYKWIAIAIASLMVLLGGTYTVGQAEQVVLVQFGEPIGGIVSTPGLHFKVPFIQSVRRFDRRVLRWDGDVSQVPTLGREFVLVDTTARWRITDPLLFMRRVRNEDGARTRLDDIIDSATRDTISGTELEEIVRSSDWQVDVSRLAVEEAEVVDTNLEKPTKGRAQLEKDIFVAASRLTPELGIELMEIRIKRVNYIESVRAQVENRMISERQAIAARFRSEGEGKKHEILGDMERKLLTIRSDAQRKAQEIIGQADAEATKIYGKAFGADPEFYAFFRTLESYSALGANTTLMVPAESDFYRYLKTSGRQ